MKYAAPLLVLSIFIGCSQPQTTTRYTDVRTGYVDVTPPKVVVEDSVFTEPDSISLRSEPSEGGPSVYVRPDLDTMSPSDIRDIKAALAKTKKWLTRIEVQPPMTRMAYEDTVTNVTTVTVERSVMQQILDYIPIALGLIAVIGVIVLAIKLYR